MKPQRLITDDKTLEKIRSEVIDEITTLVHEKFGIDDFKLEIFKIANDFLSSLEQSGTKRSPIPFNLEQFYGKVDKLYKKLQTIHVTNGQKHHSKEKNILNSLNKIILSFKETIKQVDYFSTHDHVTHLHNRVFFYERLLAEIARSERSRHEFILLLIDVDDFKNINDQYEHDTGDKVLLKLAELLQNRLRTQDIICRIADDEFGIILPETEAKSGLLVAQALKEKISSLQFYDHKKNRFKCTVSIGMVIYPHDAKTQHYLLLQADNTLKYAKKTGKNKISTCADLHDNDHRESIFEQKINNQLEAPGADAVLPLILNIIQQLNEKEKMLHKVNKIHKMSLRYDPLTQLPNRDYFTDTLNKTFTKANKKQKKIALILLSINNFHEINNLLGFDLGNIILNIVAKKLKNVIHSDNFISRLGNDEYGIILNDIHSIQEVDNLLSQCLNAFDAPLIINHHEIKLSLTSGVSIYPDMGTSADELLQHASTAMHHAKKINKGGFEYFNETLNTAIRRRHELEVSLMHALNHHEFYLVYQPQLCLKTNTLCGIEALIRWHSERFGLVSPEEFIPIAEQTGLIEKIGSWVLDKSIHDFKKIKEMTPSKEIKLGINVSILQLSNPSFDSEIKKLFQHTGVLPKDLVLEVTETAIMKDPENTYNTLARIARLGVKFSLDDFGIGYSSMRYLKLLPISSLKIDRSFVNGIPEHKNDVAIIKAIISLGVSLDLFIVAEGVETKEQLDFLKRMKCPAAQGFFFAKPLEMNELIAFIQQS